MRAFALSVLLLLAACRTAPIESAQTVAAPPPVTEAEMRGFIAALASDSFEGRMAGTVGERRTTDFLVAQLKAAGVDGAADSSGGYLMPFAIPAQHRSIPPKTLELPDGQREFMADANRLGPITSHNVIGVVRGRHPDGRTVLLMAHWDHLGICRPEGEADRICNGAVDNASGTAAVLAVARRVGAMRLDRDVLFVFTGAEEWGLLGAKALAEKPPIPLGSIVAGFNLDTIAVAPAGMPVAMVATPNSPLAPLVREAASAVGRTFDGDDEAKGFLRRQDGWPLAGVGVPMVMAGGSFSDMKRLTAFLAAAYHSHDDELRVDTDLGGAVDDANLHVELVRRAASTSFRPK